MAGEQDGGPEPHPERDAYADLRTSVIAWRLGGSTIALVFLMAGQSTALLFVASLIAAAFIFAAGSALARIEARVHALRTERRR